MAFWSIFLHNGDDVPYGREGACARLRAWPSWPRVTIGEGMPISRAPRPRSRLSGARTRTTAGRMRPPCTTPCLERPRRRARSGSPASKRRRTSPRGARAGKKDRGITRKPAPTEFKEHMAKNCRRCKSEEIVETGKHTRNITETPPPPKEVTTQHTIHEYDCKGCGLKGFTPETGLPDEGAHGTYEPPGARRPSRCPASCDRGPAGGKNACLCTATAPSINRQGPAAGPVATRILSAMRGLFECQRKSRAGAGADACLATRSARLHKSPTTATARARRCRTQ